MILAVFVIAIPLAYSVQRFPVPGFCKYICPAGTFEGAMGLLANPVNAEKFPILNILFTRKFIIMVAIFTACIFCYRAFCRFLCPLGAIYGLLARLSVLGVKVEAGKCTGCGRCVAHCRMDIRQVGDHECISCGICINVCPAKAISLKAGKLVLTANETGKPGETPDLKKVQKRRMRSLIAWAAALVVLAGVMIFVNRDAQTAQVEPAATVTETAVATVDPLKDDAPVGKEVGMRCPDFTVPLYGKGGTYTLSQHEGKVRVLNFWATWCTPCVGELPEWLPVLESCADSLRFSDAFWQVRQANWQQFFQDSAMISSTWNQISGMVLSSWSARSASYDRIMQAQSDATLSYDRFVDTQTGKTYRAEQGLMDGYDGQRFEKLETTSDPYGQSLSGYLYRK